MRFSRRQMIVLGLAAIVLPAGGYALWGAPARVVHGALQQAFGAEVADHAEALAFVAEYLGRYRALAQTTPRASRLWNQSKTLGLPLFSAAQLGDDAVQTFLTSTNVVQAAETGAGLRFVALHNPYESPCTNQLTANWL